MLVKVRAKHKMVKHNTGIKIAEYFTVDRVKEKYIDRYVKALVKVTRVGEFVAYALDVELDKKENDIIWNFD